MRAARQMGLLTVFIAAAAGFAFGGCFLALEFDQYDLTEPRDGGPRDGIGPPADASDSSSPPADADADADADAGRAAEGGTDGGFDGRRAFLTSTGFSGDLGGVAGGDAKCVAAARRAGFSEGFLAFLGTPSAPDPRSRFPDAGSWYRVDGTKLFDDGLTGFPLAPLNRSENGAAVADTEVWTGDGICPGSDTCQSWTSASSLACAWQGSALSTNAEWSRVGTSSCNGAGLRLYCFAVP